jgi:hypothetical protein
MNTTIIFGTKKLGQAQEAVSKEKYPNFAVVTVEGQKGAKKSRRILLNTKAADLLHCDLGETQRIVFASLETGTNNSKQVLIANAGLIDSELQVTYKTSKNAVSYTDSKEKGKAITSTHACNEIFSFLGMDDTQDIEFHLTSFESQEVEAYLLSDISSIDPELRASFPEAAASSTEVPVLDTNSGTMSGEDLSESIKAEVAKAEAESPVLEEVTEDLDQGEDPTDRDLEEEAYMKNLEVPEEVDGSEWM